LCGRTSAQINLVGKTKNLLLRYYDAWKNVEPGFKTPDGKKIPLYDVVNLNLESAPSSISREDGKSYINVYARVNGKVANSKELIAKINKKFLSGWPGFMIFHMENQDSPDRLMN